MKIADVTVGTEYAYTHGQARNETDWSLLRRSSRVLVHSIVPGGKVRVSNWDREAKAFRETSFEARAVNLVMPWAEAVPQLEEIARDQIRRRREARAQVEREQVALRRLGQFLEQSAPGMAGLPWTLKGSIALANGDEGLKDMGTLGMRPTHRHEPKIEVNVTVLTDLIVKAYTQGYEDAANQKPTAAFTYEGA